MIINQNLDEQKIDEAIFYFENSTDEQLFEFLDGNDDVLKQIAVLKLDKVENAFQVDKILNTLTDHPSETREYCSFLVNRLLKNEDYQKYFSSEKAFSNIERAIFDVNPKVCRKIIEVLPNFIQLNELYPSMIRNCFDLIELLQEKNKEKNYLYNKKSFHLYWHVFALGYTLDKNLFEKYQKSLVELLNALLEFNEYTLREKGAYLVKQLLNYSKTVELIELLDKYTNDKNFYVKEILD